MTERMCLHCCKIHNDLICNECFEFYNAINKLIIDKNIKSEYRDYLIKLKEDKIRFFKTNLKLINYHS
jgi:hypothetical protein